MAVNVLIVIDKQEHYKETRKEANKVHKKRRKRNYGVTTK